MGLVEIDMGGDGVVVVVVTMVGGWERETKIRERSEKYFYIIFILFNIILMYNMVK